MGVAADVARKNQLAVRGQPSTSKPAQSRPRRGIPAEAIDPQP